jgi:hypothetical protein
MRRVVLVALLLGALTTWFIAIGIANLVRWDTMVNGAAGAKSPTWVFRQWRSFGHVSSNYNPCFDDRMIAAYEGTKPGLVPWWSRMHRVPVRSHYTDDQLGVIWYNETGFGWPLASFVADTTYDGRVRGAGNHAVRHRGSITWERGSRMYVLLYQPIWLGFTGNALMLAGVWLFILMAPGAVRRRRRRARGLCGTCGYDLRGEAGVCPECGTAPSTTPSAP